MDVLTVIDRPVRPGKLRRELRAAGLRADIYGRGEVAGQGYSPTGELHCEPADVAACEAVVVAHDATTPDATEATVDEDQAAGQDFLAQFAGMLADLDDIEAKLSSSKQKLDDAYAQWQTTPPTNVNQCWQATRTLYQETPDIAQQAIRTMRVLRRAVKAQRATLHGAAVGL